VAAIDEIAKEDVIYFGGTFSNFVAEEVEEVVELAVDVAYDGDGGADGLDVGFFHEEFRDGGAESFHGGFGYGFSRFESGDVGVDIVETHDGWK
jgi:hypothetical protein